MLMQRKGFSTRKNWATGLAFALAGLIGCSDSPSNSGGAVTSITLTAARAELTSLTQTTNIAAADGRGRSLAAEGITWRSSDSSIVAVNARGVALAIAEGTATIEAALGNAQGSIQITVRQAVASVTMGTIDTLRWLGKTLATPVSAKDSAAFGIARPVLQWSSTDSSIVRVDASGRLTAVANGSATITARAGTVTASGQALVRQAPGRIEVTPAFVKLRVLGDTTRFHAVVRDSGGALLTGHPVTWSTNRILASADSSGRITALQDGETAVTAEAGVARGSGLLLINTRGAVRIQIRQVGTAPGDSVVVQFAKEGAPPPERTQRTVHPEVVQVVSGIPPGRQLLSYGGMPPGCMPPGLQGEVDVVAADTVSVEMTLRCFGNVVTLTIPFSGSARHIRLLGLNGYPRVHSEQPVQVAFAGWDASREKFLIRLATGPAEIWDVNGAGPQVVPGILESDREVRFTAEGTRIALLRWATDSTYTLMTVRPDGSDPRSLSTFLRGNVPLQFSNQGDMWVINARRPGATRATIAVLGPGPGQVRWFPETVDGVGAPRISPDGSKVLFMASVNEIYTANIDGSSFTNVTHNNERNGSPNWTRDSKSIVFASENNLRLSDIVSVDFDGSNYRKITTGRQDRTPEISPDGRFIVFSRDGQTVIAMPLDGSWQHPLLHQYSGAMGTLFMGEAHWQR